MEDEWQFVESPNDDTEEPADPHMNTPKPSPSPTPQSTAADIIESNETKSTDTLETADNTSISEEKADQTEKPDVLLVESPKSEEISQVTAGKYLS